MLPGEGVDFLLRQFAMITDGLLGPEAEWFNKDEQLSSALSEMLKARREVAAREAFKLAARAWHTSREREARPPPQAPSLSLGDGDAALKPLGLWPSSFFWRRYRSSVRQGG